MSRLLRLRQWRAPGEYGIAFGVATAASAITCAADRLEKFAELAIARKAAEIKAHESPCCRCNSGYALLVLVPDFQSVLNKPVRWNRCTRTQPRLAKLS